MQAPLNKKSDMKILILYLLYKISEPVDYVTLYDLSTVDELIGGFDFVECYSELVSAGNIDVLEDESIQLTDQGKQVVESLQNNLLYSTRENIAKQALAFVEYKKSGRKMDYSVEIGDDGKPVFNCNLADKDGVILSLSVKLDDEEKLNKVVNNWNNRPDSICRGINSVLSGEIDSLLN